jgi:hypothetical protein
VRRSRITKVAAPAAAAAFVLSGCGVHPGAAAVVGDAVITEHQVDAVAEGLCSANVGGAAANGQPAQDLASRGARQGALQVLLDSELSRQLGEQEGVEPDQEQVSAALARNEQGIAMLPEDQRPAFKDALRTYAEGQLVLLEAGRKSLAEQGQSSPTDDAALAEGSKLRAAYAKRIDIEVDPRFGTYSDGNVRPESGSLSVAVSSRAFDGQSSDPSAAWVSALPASQKCH